MSDQPLTSRSLTAKALTVPPAPASKGRLTEAERPRVRSVAQRSNPWIAHAILALGGLGMVAPLIYQVLMSLSTNAEVQSTPPTFWPESFQWENYSEVFRTSTLGSAFFVSIAITVLRVVGQLILCSLAGYAFARMDFPFKGLALGAVLAIIMVPSQVYLIPQYQIIQNLGWLNTVAGIVAPGFFSAFGVFHMTQVFKGLPQELEDAARLDGANPWQIFWHVMLPLTKNGLWALGIITILWSWNELLWPLVIASKEASRPLSVALANLQGEHQTNYPVLMAASLLAMAPVLVFFIVMQKRVMEGIGRSGLK